MEIQLMSVIKWRVQWTLVTFALCASLVFIVSCRQQASSSGGPGPAASTMPVATTQPAAPAGPAPSTIDYVALGFHYPPAATIEQSRAHDDKFRANANAICIACHKPDGGAAVAHTDSDTMHTSGVGLTCIDCHGGPGDRIQTVRADIKPTDPDYNRIKFLVHVQPTANPDLWRNREARELLYTATLQENPDFIRFINPGDLRAARVSCGTTGCHERQVHDVPKSMMTHGAMLW